MPVCSFRVFPLSQTCFSLCYFFRMWCFPHGKGKPPKSYDLRPTWETETFYTTTDKHWQEVSKKSGVKIGKGINFYCDNRIIHWFAFVNLFLKFYFKLIYYIFSFIIAVLYIFLKIYMALDKIKIIICITMFEYYMH